MKNGLFDLTKYVEVGDCHEWIGSYGTGKNNRTPVIAVWRDGCSCNISVRRIAYSDHGPIQPGRPVYMTCGNYRCIRIDHLRSGTRRQQVLQAAADGRMRCTPQRRARQAAAARANSRYSPEQIARVRALIAEGLNDRQIDRQTGVRYQTVGKVRKGTAWRETMPGADVFSMAGALTLGVKLTTNPKAPR